MGVDHAQSQASPPVFDELEAAEVRPSAAEDRAVVRGRARGAREESHKLHVQVAELHSEARRAADLAVAALAEADGLRRAMDSRAQIEMAKGILIERHNISPDEAFRMLVATSQRGQLKLAEVARALVEKTAGTVDG